MVNAVCTTLLHLQLIFPKSAKVGGTSIMSYFTTCSDHDVYGVKVNDFCLEFEDIFNATTARFLKEHWNEYFVFTFARSPLHRAVSQFQVSAITFRWCWLGYGLAGAWLAERTVHVRPAEIWKVQWRKLLGEKQGLVLSRDGYLRVLKHPPTSLRSWFWWTTQIGVMQGQARAGISSGCTT